jgi:hypothetical protein
MSAKYTTNKIYFTVKNPTDFIDKYKDYLLNTKKVFEVKTYEYNDKHYINICLLFNTGKLNQKTLNDFMNAFILDNNITTVNKATYKYSDNKNTDIHLIYTIDL